jgi:hypothetical protein
MNAKKKFRTDACPGAKSHQSAALDDYPGGHPGNPYHNESLEFIQCLIGRAKADGENWAGRDC